MQLETLQQQWQRLDQKLEQTLALQTELMRQVVMQPARRRLHRLAIWPALDIAFSGCVLLLGITFLSSHGHDWKQVMPAVVVMLGALGLLVSSILQLQQVSQFDWDGPVADIQARLEQLRVMKIQQFKWVILSSPLVGFCAFIVSLHWLF